MFSVSKPDSLFICASVHPHVWQYWGEEDEGAIARVQCPNLQKLEIMDYTTREAFGSGVQCGGFVAVSAGEESAF